MKPIFTEAVVYQILARCLTPLRTGDESGSPDKLLTASNGQFLLQGTSLSGALRNYLEPSDLQDHLFGSQRSPGCLTISDGLFDTDCQSTQRPRIRIDGATGTAATGAKFDTCQLCSGSRFRFTLVWTGTEENPSDLHEIEQLLSALHHGEILLGAEKSNGFGRVSLEVRKRIFHLRQEADRTAWMQDLWDGEPLVLPELDAPHSVIFQVQASVPRILAGSGSAQYQQEQKSDQQSAFGTRCNIMENGRCILPGSSFKGAVLGHLIGVAAHLGVAQPILEEAFGRECSPTDNGRAGAFAFHDVLLERNAQPITRIRIDRFTGGVMTGGLFHAEPLTSQMTAEICGPAQQNAACALLLFALRDLGLGLYNLGSGWAVGWGLPQIKQITASYGKKSLTLRFSNQQQIEVLDPDGLAQQWLSKLREVCHAD